MRKLNLVAIVIAASFAFYIESVFCQTPKFRDTPPWWFHDIGLENLPRGHPKRVLIYEARLVLGVLFLIIGLPILLTRTNLIPANILNYIPPIY
jgi:hypothetical protein